MFKKIMAPAALTDVFAPIHPGEILYKEFMEPMGLSQNKLATCLNIPVTRVNAIVHSQRAITADTAKRLSLYFGNSIQFWLGLQMDYEIDVIEQDQNKIMSEVRAPKRA